MHISTDAITPAHVRLALAIGQHIPDYIDAYYGPPEWQRQAEADGPRPVTELAREAADLAMAIADDTEMDPQRRDFLAREARAMQTSLRILQGERFTLTEETEALYDITPEWVDEAVFEEAHRALNELLPPGDSLVERRMIRKETIKVPIEPDMPLLHEIVAELCHRTRARFPLPPDESFEIQLVSDKPWSAYNWYLGDFRSRIDINTDLPIGITRLAGMLAHEGYPGHHTELAIKESRLVREKGWIEHTVAVLNSPSCVIAEGIATRALSTLVPDDELVAWYADELFPRAGLGHLDAQRERAIDNASRKLSGVPGNAAFLMYDQNADESEIVAYIQRYGLNSEEEAGKAVGFLKYARSYVFTYHYGGEMLDALFAAQGDRDHWFTRLLTESVTPSQIRARTAGGA
jgi:hypothetical protein